MFNACNLLPKKENRLETFKWLRMLKMLVKNVCRYIIVDVLFFYRLNDLFLLRK